MRAKVANNLNVGQSLPLHSKFNASFPVSNQKFIFSNTPFIFHSKVRTCADLYSFDNAFETAWLGETGRKGLDLRSESNNYHGMTFSIQRNLKGPSMEPHGSQWFVLLVR